MQSGPRILLLIDSDPGAHKRIAAMVADSPLGIFELESATRLSHGLKRIAGQEIAAVLLNLNLPDSQGIESFERVFLAAPEIPILILGRNAEDAVAMEAISRGAQDYLVPADLSRSALPRALLNAIGRNRWHRDGIAGIGRAMNILNSLGDGIVCTDTTGHVAYLNPSAETITGWGIEEARSRPLEEVFCLVDVETREAVRNPMLLAAEEDHAVQSTANCILISRNGVESTVEDSAAPLRDGNGLLLGAVMVLRDGNMARSKARDMAYSAHHDPLTNLPNRLLLNDRISQSIATASRLRSPIAILFLDLDRFKHVNDTMGHLIGDKLLQSVSGRLLACLRGADTVSRQGGDEFVVLLSNILSRDDAARSARRILFALKAPHVVDGQKLHIGASIGIAMYPQDGEDAEALIHNADVAMYCAKEAGANCFHFFTAKMNREAAERQALEAGLRDAVEREEFSLCFQPKVRLDTSGVTGCETLLRWNRPGAGVIPPLQFVSVAEQTGLIIEIGRWVLRQACRQARLWQHAGLRPIPVAVNVSAVEFREKGFVQGIKSILAETGLEPDFLELEFTEGVLMKDSEAANATLRRLKQIGIKLALDDFGTGFSSLSYLRQFPIDALKIDRSFIRQISSNPDDSLLVASIIHMGNSLRHRVVAEGIETQQQRDYLRYHRCAEGQGYLFARPLEPARFASLLAAGI